MSKQISSANSIKNDYLEGGASEMNPFSFKEFVRNKNQSSNTEGYEDKKSCLTQKEDFGGTFLEEDCFSSKHFDIDLQEPFFSDPTPFPQSLDNDVENWSGSYQPSEVEDAHAFGIESSPFLAQSSGPNNEAGTVPFWLDSRYSQDSCHGRSTESYDGALDTSIGDITCDGKKSNMECGVSNEQMLREENTQLRKHIKKLLKTSELDNQRIQHLMQELHKRRLQEEQEAKDLETMVHSVEKNLQIMTKRAMKAENSVSKLKLEVLQLQGQLEGFRCENERLRAKEAVALKTMKEKAQLASQYLSKAASNAESSIKQLLTGAETLYLVSQILDSIDKITDLQSEDQ